MTDTRRPRLLWIGDAVTHTGFARVTHNVLAHLHSIGWDIKVLGVNYRGDPHTYPYDIFPAFLGGDVFGVGRSKGLSNSLKPDVVVINSDPWIVSDHLAQLPSDIPVVAYMPVDAPNQGSAMRLNSLAHAVAYTKFGKKELMLGGYTGPSSVIPHGVSLDTYRPMTKADARKHLTDQRVKDIPKEDLFIVGNVNRNQPRKRLDLTIEYWTEWWRQAGCPRNAFLYLHCSARAEGGWDLPQLAEFYGIDNRLLMSSRNMTSEMAVKEQDLRVIYGFFDVQLSTTTGEGWGLTTFEGMACSIAQAVPEYSALGEWARGAVLYIPVTSFLATPDDINTIAGVPDKDATVAAIQELYANPELRTKLGDAGRALVERPEYRWPAIGAQFDELLRSLIGSKKVRSIERAKA